MFVCLSLSVDLSDGLLQSFVVHHVILAFLRVVGRGEDKELRREGIEHRRYGREAVTAAGEINIFLAQGQQELLHIYAVAWTYVSLAVVEDKKTVHEVVLDVFEHVFLAVTYQSSCASILPDTFRKVGMHKWYVFPFVFVRRYYQRATSFFKSLSEDLTKDCRLSGSGFAHEHELEHLTRFLRFLFRLLFLRLQLLRIV